jgi:hypothetical protein
MNSRAEYGTDDPRQHTRKIKEMLHVFYAAYSGGHH